MGQVLTRASTIIGLDPSIVLRPASGLAEWGEVRALCCLTGNAGDPIEPARWRFFGEHWVGPYQRLRPEWATVALRRGRVVGYLTGCPDTARFAREKRWYFEFPLLLKIAAGGYDRHAGDVARFVRHALKREKAPEEFFSASTQALLKQRFPAHLHVNVEASARGSGLGAALMRRYFNRLRAEGVAGVHVFCGKKPVPFYERQGFGVLESIEYRIKPGSNPVPVYALGINL